jgi:hypothetical protein
MYLNYHFRNFFPRTAYSPECQTAQYLARNPGYRVLHGRFEIITSQRFGATIFELKDDQNVVLEEEIPIETYDYMSPDIRTDTMATRLLSAKDEAKALVGRPENNNTGNGKSYKTEFIVFVVLFGVFFILFLGLWWKGQSKKVFASSVHVARGPTSMIT